MSEVNAYSTKGKLGEYVVNYRSDKPDVVAIEWNDKCVGLVKNDKEKICEFVKGVKAGKDFDEIWAKMEMGAEALDMMLPVEPYFVFCEKAGKTEIVFSTTDLEEAQAFAFDYIDKSTEDICVYVTFNTGRYYRDGTVTCVNNVLSKGEPPKSLPFKKVLSMDVEVAKLMLGKKE